MIDQSHYRKLKQTYADIPHFATEHGVKIPAAWLIEQCGLKGYSVGGIGVYQHHGLVLVNHTQGNGEQVLALVRHIRHLVKRTFQIALQIEVRLVGQQGLLELD